MDLVKEHSPFLRTHCIPYVFNDGNEYLFDLLSKMHEIMSTHKGVGLAAPQCGITYRIFIMDISGQKFNIINPDILEYSKEESILEEGCLSFPGLYLKVKRSKKIVAQWFDEYEKEHIKELGGMQARVFQHEYHHLMGITFKECVSKLRLQMAEKKRKKYGRFIY